MPVRRQLEIPPGNLFVAEHYAGFATALFVEVAARSSKKAPRSPWRVSRLRMAQGGDGEQLTRAAS